MPNQMIALQGRTPQGFDVGRMVQQNAQLINMMSQQRAADRQAEAFQTQQQRTAQEMDFARNAENRTARLAVPQQTEAEAKADTARLTLYGNFLGESVEAISSARTPEEAIAQGNRLKEMFPAGPFVQSVDETLASIPQDPAQYIAWRDDALARTMDAKDQLSQELRPYNTGRETGIITTPTFRGAPGGNTASVVPGSQVEAAEGIKFVTMPDGSIVPMPDTVPGTGGPIGGGPSGGGAGVADTAGVFDRMINRESRGQQFARDGSPLTSPAGAIGVAQVMPGTAPEAAQLAGLPFDDNRYRTDREYNLALGRAYFEKQLADFGDPALAAAAYNAGPGRVRQALARGGPDGWLQHVPRETRDYVTAAMGGGTANQTTPRAGGPPAANAAPFRVGQPIPGSTPQAIEANTGEAYTATANVLAKYDNTIQTAQRLLDNPALDSILGNVQGNVPETVLSLFSQDAANALADYNTLLAVAGFQELQAMRDASPTGGALGPVSDRENIFLRQSAFSSARTQREDRFRDALRTYINRVRESRGRIENAYQRQFGEPAAAPASRSTNGPRGQAAPASGSDVDMNNPLLRGM